MDKQAIRISRNVFFNVLHNLEKETSITIEALTNVRMNKKNNPFYNRIQKLQVLNGIINFVYEDVVNKQLELENKEKNFIASNRKWGEHDTKSIIINNNHYYLQIMPEKLINVVYFCDSEPISKDEISPWLKLPYKNKKQNTDKEILVRTFKSTSIISVTLNKTHYELF